MGRLNRLLRGTAAFAALLTMAVFLRPPSARADIAERFAGYPPAVRDQAVRVVAAAGPGKDVVLEKEIRALRKLMYARGLLSLNAVPELIFERSVREGWRRGGVASVRAAMPISPLSASAWALLVKSDIVEARLDDLPRDFEGLAGAMRQFAPALFGYGAWLVSYLSAAACWFVTWASIALFLRARSSLEADLSRIVAIPLRDFVSAALAAGLFLLPLLAGQGLAVAACFWMVLSAGYLRRYEFVVVTAVVVLLAGLLAGGAAIHSVNRIGADMRRGRWVAAEGFLPSEWPAEGTVGSLTGAGPPSSWMVKFAKARAAMIAGDPAESERLWTELVKAGKGTPEVYNNRGISRAMQGKTPECLSDFETVLAARPQDGPALWNAYQVYLQTFNLERARAVQPLAWYSLKKMSPYYFKPADMEAGEWVASPFPAEDLLRSIGGPDFENGEGDLFRMFFRPLKPSGALVFLVSVLLAGSIWKVLSMRIWVNTTCRGCGARTLIAGARGSLDLCNLCRAGIGGGVKGGGERDRRIQGIGMHRRYVWACSVLVPGSGTLWAGNEIRALVFGIVLALSLAGITASAGRMDGGAILSDLRHSVTMGAAAVSAAVWIAGAAWGIRSFGRFQETVNLSGGRR